MGDNAGQRDYRALLQRAMAALDDMEAKLAASEARRHEPIAVIGMGCRFPGEADTPEAFWSLLERGDDAVTEVPPERWSLEKTFDPDPDRPGKSYTKWGAFLNGIDRFDAGFFGNSPREAIAMDPQHRLLLEVAWEALEHAAIAPPSLARSRSGVFIGMTGTDYADLQLKANRIEELDAYFGTGISHSIAAGRLAYTFDFQGPAIAFDTACSSSLVATHAACQALRAGECDLALGGGVNLMLSPDGHISTSRARMMSFEGRCKTFDAAADGYVRAEGCALLVLKRLSDAQADGDRVLAVIRGTAINQDGRSNGLTAPSAAAQESVIRAALADARVEPAAVDFVECHGTGTTLGDPIEIRALDAVFGPGRDPRRKLRVQSVKTNVGHLEAAAGIVGLCKLILALQHKMLPRHLHLSEPNPYIPWDDVAVAPTAGPEPWERPDGSLRIGAISSFGFSGTNSHMVVEEAPIPTPRPAGEAADGPRVYAVSAKSAAALEAQVERHAAALEALSGDPLAAAWSDVTHSANACRAHFNERVAVVADSPVQAAERLRAAVEDPTPDALRGQAEGEAAEAVFLFTGQGAQVPGMGRHLHESQPQFRRTLDRCAEVLREIGGFDLLEVMFADGTDGRLHETRFTQPALFAFEVAMASLWRSWGVEPIALMGHSIGEIAAAHVAGVVSLEDGLRLIEARGRLMQELPRDGGMAAVFADEPLVRQLLAPHAADLSIAALNGPRNVVVSGRNEALDAVLAAFEADGVRAKRLVVSHAFHSPLMEPMLDAFEQVAAGLSFHEPEIDLISNGTGRPAQPGELTQPRYWREHVRHAVRFRESVASLIDEGHRLFLEVGPAPTLSGMAKRCDVPDDAVWIPAARSKTDGGLELQRALAAFYVAGGEPDWAAVEAVEAPRTVDLPRYAFQRSRYWHPLAHADAAAAPSEGHADGAHPLLGRPLRSPRLDGSVFEARLEPSRPDWVAEHDIYDTVLLPATALLEMARAAGVARSAGAGQPFDVVDFRIEEPLALAPGQSTTVQTLVDEAGDDRVEIYSEGEAGWRRHAVGRLAPRIETAGPADRAGAEERCNEPLGGEDYYETLQAMGVRYGPRFRRIEAARRRDGEVIGRLIADESLCSDPAIPLHPALLDGCLQLMGLAMPGAGALDADRGDVYLPMGIGRYQPLRRGGPGRWSLHGRLREDQAGEIVTADLELRDASGAALARFEEVRFKRAPRQALQGGGPDVDEWLYSPGWKPAPLAADAEGLPRGRWLIVHDGCGLGEALIERLRHSGADVGAVSAGDAVPTATLAEALGGDEPVAGVVLAWGLERQEGAVLPSARLDDAAWSLVALLQACGQVQQSPPLTVLTRQCWTVAPGDGARGAVQAPVWGVGRVLASEQPGRYCRLVDLDGNDDVERVLEELRADDREQPQVAWRDGRRFALRLVRHGEAEALDLPDGAYRLEVAERGTLEGLQLVAADLPDAPGPGEVVVDVRATGLNFRDVLNTLDMYEGGADSLGSECAGEVVAVGPGVDRVRPGDRVLAVADASFASRVHVPQAVVAPIPADWSYAQAATLPIAFLTADYALNRLGRMQPGQRVLIHAGAGGVGMAAIQLAQRAGAEVFATAGSDAKRRFLRQAGVAHVFDSRALDFAEEIRRITDGAGVDLVLNSLTGESIAKSVEVLSDRGRFLEIGKAGIWSPERFHQVRPDAGFHVIFLGQVCAEQPETIREMLDELVRAATHGELQPLPRTCFGIRSAVDAFRFMAQAKQIGKVVVTAHRGWNIASAAGSWIVTGGTGGLGFATAQALVDAGVRRLVLGGRREPTGRVAEAIATWRERGVDVRVCLGDIGDREVVQWIVAEAVDGERLSGVVHAAGLLDDRMLRDLGRDSLQQVMRPKLEGALHLAEATAHLEPDHFVLFSAGAVLFGAPGQGNYAAANAGLDALAQTLQASGRAGQSINWGPWSDVGMAARMGDEALRRWESQGLGSLSPDEGIGALRTILADGRPQIAALPIRWPSLLHYFSKHHVPPIMEDLVRVEQRRQVRSKRSSVEPGWVESLQALPVEGRAQALEQRVREQLLRVLGLESSHPVSPTQGLSDLGMDSLMAVELSNRLGVLVDRSLPSTLAFEYPTLSELIDYLRELLADRVPFKAAAESDADAAVGADTPSGRSPQEASAAAELSDAELEAELLRELDDAGY